MDNELRVGKCITTLLCVLLVSSCATTPSPAASRIQAADQATVAGCTFVGDVSGSSGWGNLAASEGMQNAKNEGLERAAEMGATHVMWVNIAGGYSPYATGKAYKCK